jgi:petrobactin synthase
MIKVHCFVSCVCEVIKKTEGVDHRPYYFGVWDADFDVLENGVLTYHSDSIDHDFFHTWYEMLYGIKLYKWYDDERTKQENIEKMLRLLDNKTPNQYVMVMLDLSALPERENKFHQRPFPHYVMLETTEKEDEWFMYDPDFRWEGVLPKERILAAIKEPSVEGGYYFDADSIIPPDTETVEAYFNTCIKHDRNPMTDAVSEIIRAHIAGFEEQRLSGLTSALKQLPVLAIRKYAYEHAFAYFWEALGLDEEGFEAWCHDIESLVNGYTTIQYRAMKLSMTGDITKAAEVFSKLSELNLLEFKIKQGLQECFNEWSIAKISQEKKVESL